MCVRILCFEFLGSFIIASLRLIKSYSLPHPDLCPIMNIKRCMFVRSLYFGFSVYIHYCIFPLDWELLPPPLPELVQPWIKIGVCLWGCFILASSVHSHYWIFQLDWLRVTPPSGFFSSMNKMRCMFLRIFSLGLISWFFFIIFQLDRLLLPPPSLGF